MQYQEFAEPRLRPALDLIARLDLLSPEIVCDLGCGTGNVTARLARRWPTAEVTGIDSSATMLAEARRRLPQIRWQQSDIAGWAAPRAPDLIFSNAALHWLPDHQQLLPSLLRQLRPGGILAVQMPNNFAAPSHTAIAATVHAGPWRDSLRPLLQPPPVRGPREYFDILGGVAAAVDIWETEYLQVLSGVDPVKEWTKGTWLKQFLDRLTPTDSEAFEADYAARVRCAYPTDAAGRTLFPFRRLFLVARVAAAG